MTSTIGFPFTDTRLTSSIFDTSDLGRAFDRKTKKLSGPLFIFSGPSAHLIKEKVPNPALQESDQLCKSVNDVRDCMGVDGELSCHYGMVNGEGKGSFSSESVHHKESFVVMQKCTYIVGFDQVDLGELAKMSATEEGQRQVLHPTLLESEEAAVDMIDTHGDRFVSRLVRGGVAFRRITYTYSAAKDLRKVKADMEAKIKTGSFDLGFKANFEKNDGSETSDVDINVDTTAIGGDPKLFKFTKDPMEAMAQLDDWKASVLLESSSVVVSVELQDVCSAFVPVFKWSQFELDMYRQNVTEAHEAHWALSVARMKVKNALSETREAMLDAKMDIAAVEEIILEVTKEEQATVEAYIKAEQNHIVHEYLAKGAEYVKNTPYFRLFNSETIAKHEEALASLLGHRETVDRIEIDDVVIGIVWYGPFVLGLEDGRYGIPDAVEVGLLDDDVPRGNARTGGGLRKKIAQARGGSRRLLHIPREGWDIFNDAPFQGTKAIVDIIPDIAELPIDKLPRSLIQRVNGTRVFSGHSHGGERHTGPEKEYVGGWRLRHGELVFDGQGCLTYRDGSTLTGRFANGKAEGRGVWLSAKGIEFDGSFEDGLKSGLGKLTMPPPVGYTEPVVVSGEWENDLFHVTGGSFEDALAQVAKLPKEWQEKWSAENLRYSEKKSGKMGSYTGNFCREKRHGEGSMAYDDGRVEDGPWDMDSPVPPEVSLLDSWVTPKSASPEAPRGTGTIWGSMIPSGFMYFDGNGFSSEYYKDFTTVLGRYV